MICATIGAVLITAAGNVLTAEDWPCWRGPKHDGVSTEKGWLTNWPKDGLKQVWKFELGPGHAIPAVCGGKVYVQGRAGKQDFVFCLNAETGTEVWKFPYDLVETPYGRGPRSTPAVDDKYVYVANADAQVFCLDAGTGQPVWNKSLRKEVNLGKPVDKISTAPVVDGDLLLLNLGVSGIALEKRTGNVVWKSEGASSDASPVPFTLAGKRCVALCAKGQLVIVAEADGKQIAMCEHKPKTGIYAQCADPLIVGDSVFVTTGYNVGSALISVSGDSAKETWQIKKGCVYASPVLVGDYIYALIESGWEKADLTGINVRENGSIKWTQKDIGSGGLMVADGKLLILSRTGELILAEASPAAYKEIARAKAFSDGAADPKAKPASCWNSPVLSNGRIYVRNEKGTLVCLDARGAK